MSTSRSTTHDVGRLDDIAPGTVRKVVIGSRAIALVRIDDDVYALGDTCSHDDVSLSEGYVDCDEKQLECGRHGALFDLATGEPASLPAVRPVPVYAVEVVDGMVRLTVEDGGGDVDE
ncbi:MAG: non-heme iron oxygenase ferredoxin subunit [Acidimicrobiales bacterium]